MDINEGRLRPLEESDLAMVLKWRNSDRVRSFMFTNHLISREEHLRWFRGIDPQQRQCLIFELRQEACGLVNIYQIDRRNRCCAWGFYIGSSAAPRGAGLLMGYLAMEYIFKDLSMLKLCSEALVANTVSIAYHHNLGFTDEGVLNGSARKDGRPEDVLQMTLLQEQWLMRRDKVRDKLQDYQV